MSYWEYYNFPRAAPRPKAKPGKERKKFGNTWWGKKWVDMLSKYEGDQRMSRGRAYARADKVKKFKVDKGIITAIVDGSLGNYKVSVKFKKHDDKEWLKIIKKLNKTPIILGSLLNNDMPENIEKHIRTSLIPNSFNSKCSCPDYANPCKHIAAVFYTIADEIDYDPMLLFKIAGMSKEDILNKLGVLENVDKFGSEEIKTKRTKKGEKNKIGKKEFIKNKESIGLKPEVFFKPQIWRDRPKGRGIKSNLSNKTKNMKSKIKKRRK